MPVTSVNHNFKIIAAKCFNKLIEYKQGYICCLVYKACCDWCDQNKRIKYDRKQKPFQKASSHRNPVIYTDLG